jgi:hypothetical protein
MPLNFHTVYKLSTIYGGTPGGIDLVMAPIAFSGGWWLRMASETKPEVVIHGEEIEDSEKRYVLRRAGDRGPIEYVFEPLTRDMLLSLNRKGTLDHDLAMSARNDGDVQEVLWTDWMTDLGSEEELRALLRSSLTEGKSFPVGTVRTWGKRQVIKTKEGWKSFKDDGGGGGAAASGGGAGGGGDDGGDGEERRRRRWKEKAEGLPDSTLDAHYTLDSEGRHVPSKERAELHKKIFKEVFKNVNKVQKPVAVFTVGAPASGKSSALDAGNPLDGVFGGAARIDPDRIKKMLPEFKEAVRQRARNAGDIVHKESALIADMFRQKAMQLGTNFLFDGVGSDPEWYAGAVQEAKDSGAHVVVIGADHPDPAELKKRNETRADKSGRVVPPRYIDHAHAKTPETYHRLESIADDMALYATDGAPGETRLIHMKSEGSSEAHDEEYFRKYKERAGIIGETTEQSRPSLMEALRAIFGEMAEDPKKGSEEELTPAISFKDIRKAFEKRASDATKHDERLPKSGSGEAVVMPGEERPPGKINMDHLDGLDLDDSD